MSDVISIGALEAAIRLPAREPEGKVRGVRGMLLEASAPGAGIGDTYSIAGRRGDVTAEVVGLEDGMALLMAYDRLDGISLGCAVRRVETGKTVPVGSELVGRVIDSMGRPVDGGRSLSHVQRRDLHAPPLPPLARASTAEPLELGVRVLDTFVPSARGQRLGIFAGPGVGKSVLLGQLAKNTRCDYVVLALIGERGREVAHFVDSVLGEEGMRRAVVVVATSNAPPLERVRAAFVATTIAEMFRDQGANVLLLVDSLTRFAMAQREIGLAAGEPPTSKGYPPSAFAWMPRLVERAGALRGGGSITAFYTVLTEGDDLLEPVADAVRGLLDGHIVLSRALAERGHFPAIDPLKSLSRLAPELTVGPMRDVITKARGWLSSLSEAQDLLSLGAYKRGADPQLDAALQHRAALETFTRQGLGERSTAADAWRALAGIVNGGSP